MVSDITDGPPIINICFTPNLCNSFSTLLSKSVPGFSKIGALYFLARGVALRASGKFSPLANTAYFEPLAQPFLETSIAVAYPEYTEYNLQPLL